MADLYAENPDGVSVYPYRMPRADGGEPLLFWMWVCAFFSVTSLSAMSFMIYYGLYREHFLKFLFELFLFCLFGAQVVPKFIRVVFSWSRREIWSQFLFFKWNRSQFRDIAEIRVRDQEMNGKTRYSYVAAKRGRYKPPIRLSAQATDMNRLSMFYYTVAPLLEDILGLKPREADTVEAADVSVDEVVVPVEQAPAILARQGARPSTAVVAARGTAITAKAGAKAVKRETAVREADAGGTRSVTGKRAKARHFKREGSVYSRSLWLHNLTMTVVSLVVFFGIGTAFMVQKMIEMGTDFVPIAMYAGGLSVTLYFMGLENMDFHIDVKKCLFVFRTGYGLRKKAFGFDSLVKFNMKSILGFHALCVVLEGQKVDPTLCVSRNPEKIHQVLEEVCGILEIEPDEWFDM